MSRSGPGIRPARRTRKRGRKRLLAAFLAASTATIAVLALTGHHGGPSGTDNGPQKTGSISKAHQPLPPDYTTATSKNARLVSTQPAAPLCPEEVVELKGSYTISGHGFKTHTATLNAPVANPDNGFFYGFFVPNALAKAFNADAAKGPVRVTVVNISPKEASSCPNPVSGKITSVSPATSSANA